MQPIDVLNKFEERGGQFIPTQIHFDIASKVLLLPISEDEKRKALWMQACVINKSKFMTVDASDVKELQDIVKKYEV